MNAKPRTFRPGHSKRRALALAFLFWICSGPATGADYYVRKGTNCTAGYPSCGVDRPGQEWDDVNQCAEVLEAGDTCWIKQGRYELGTGRMSRPLYAPQHSGRPDAPITYRGYPGHRPVFSGDVTWQLGVSGETDFVTFSGLTVEGAILVQGMNEGKRVRGVVIENCEISKGGGKNDGNWSGIFAQWTEDLTIRNNVIRDTKTNGSSKGISIFNGRRTVVEHNYIHGHPSEAIFDKEGGEDNIYRRNIFERNGKHLKINNQPDERKVYNVRTQIYENLFLCDRGGGSTSILMLKRPTDWSVYNNSGYECAGIEVRSISGPARGRQVFNNIWWRTETGKSMWASQAGDDREPDYMDHNLYAFEGRYRENRYSDHPRKFRGLAAWQTAAHPKIYDRNSLEADPRYIDPRARNFRLSKNSPARGAGRNGEDLGSWPRRDDTVIGPIGGLDSVGMGPPPGQRTAKHRAQAAKTGSDTL
ncbi:right-handed parallel beta-helix repeat-containing protein [Myxococcota bacterium]|nr:right-handed parallel beta-helix repeat-containing protein [Myxococcota bacterium]